MIRRPKRYLIIGLAFLVISDGNWAGADQYRKSRPRLFRRQPSLGARVEQEQDVPAATEKAARIAEEKIAELQAGRKPVNLGLTVYSSFNDVSPTLSRDGLTLLFHSNRPGGARRRGPVDADQPVHFERGFQ